MRMISLAMFSIYLLSSCMGNPKPTRVRTFDQFDFSYAETFSTSYTIQFTQGDTVYIRQHWASFSDTLKSEQTYFGIIPDSARQQLDSFLCNIPFDQYQETTTKPMQTRKPTHFTSPKTVWKNTSMCMQAPFLTRC